MTRNTHSASIRFAYADPPYLGSAVKRYGDEAAPFDTLEGHATLIAKLDREFDGFALSMGSKNLRDLLPLCPSDVRILAWVKTYTAFRPSVRLAWAWEPVILRGLRPPSGLATVRDWFTAPAPHVRPDKDFTGQKPFGFCLWLFRAAGLEPDDELVDLFPGSGAVGKAWEQWRAQRPLEEAAL